MIKNINDLKRVCSDKWNELKHISPEYLSDAGKAAKEAYETALWHLMFHDSIDSLVEDEEFQNLVNISGEHPEFYRVIRIINRSVERLTKEGN